MVRRGGYRTSAQRDRQNRARGGGRTRTEQLRDSLQQKRQRLRENDQKEPTFHTTPISKLVEHGRATRDDYAVYGVYRDGTEWVLTGLAASDTYETTQGTGRSQRSRTKVRSRYVARARDNLHPTVGVEILRVDTKAAAMRKAGADSSEKVDAGAYLIRPSHDPRAFHTETVSKDDWRAFIQSHKTAKV